MTNSIFFHLRYVVTLLLFFPFINFSFETLSDALNKKGILLEDTILFMNLLMHYPTFSPEKSCCQFFT